MVVSEYIHRHRALSQTLEFTRTTVIGGALFLLPIFVVLLVPGKILGLLGGLTEPFTTALGVESIGGIAVSHLVTILAFWLVSEVIRGGAHHLT